MIGRTGANCLERNASRFELDGVVMQVGAEFVNCRVHLLDGHEVLLISGPMARTAREDAEVNVLGCWGGRCLLSCEKRFPGALDAVFDALGDICASELLIDGVSVT